MLVMMVGLITADGKNDAHELLLGCSKRQPRAAVSGNCNIIRTCSEQNSFKLRKKLELCVWHASLRFIFDWMLTCVMFLSIRIAFYNGGNVGEEIFADSS